MTKMLSVNPNVSLQNIKQFEQEYEVTLPKQYVDFLLEYNGGFPQESNFKISDDEGIKNALGMEISTADLLKGSKNPPYKLVERFPYGKAKKIIEKLGPIATVLNIEPTDK